MRAYMSGDGTFHWKYDLVETMAEIMGGTPDADTWGRSACLRLSVEELLTCKPCSAVEMVDTCTSTDSAKVLRERPPHSSVMCNWRQN